MIWLQPIDSKIAQDVEYPAMLEAHANDTMKFLLTSAGVSGVMGWNTPDFRDAFEIAAMPKIFQCFR